MFLKGRSERNQERLRRSTNRRQIEERITRQQVLERVRVRARIYQQEIQIITTQAGESKSLMEKEREQLTGNDIYNALELKIGKLFNNAQVSYS
jgi:shikimate kinase